MKEIWKGKKTDKAIEVMWFLFGVTLLFGSIWLIRSGELEPIIESFGIWAPIVLVLLKASTLVVAPLGGSPFYLVAGAVFGPVNGFLLVLLGDAIGSSICFMISRRYGSRVMKFLAGKRNFEKIDEAVGLLENTKSFLKARVAFSGGPELLAYAAGLSRISFKKFFVLHVPFFIPIDLIFVFLGSHIADATVKYAFAPTILVFLISATGFWFLLKDYEKLSAN